MLGGGGSGGSSDPPPPGYGPAIHIKSLKNEFWQKAWVTVIMYCTEICEGDNYENMKRFKKATPWLGNVRTCYSSRPSITSHHSEPPRPFPVFPELDGRGVPNDVLRLLTSWEINRNEYVPLLCNSCLLLLVKNVHTNQMSNKHWPCVRGAIHVLS